MIDDYSGLQKAAILLITLGPEKASAIFQHLKEDEIESLTLEIANTRSVSPQDKESVLDEYYQVCLAQQYIAEGGIGYAKELLEKALGSEKAQGVMAQFSLALEECTQQFNIVCKVINCTQSLDNADRYFARSKFIFDRMTEREKIVRFVFEEERRIRRREME